MSIIQRSKTCLKVLGVNFAIFGILLVSPAVVFQIYTNLKPKFVQFTNQTIDKRAYYPTYADKEFSVRLFNEKINLSGDYKSFIVWRRGKVNFKYTNISGPYNARKSRGESINNSVWFFGGSTMWGTGSSDLQTIPSHFHSLTNTPVYNFGEGGWNSRQSLNQLINAIGDDHNPSVVIFYSGANEVISMCRREIESLPAHSREKQIQNALRLPPIQKRIFNFILSPYKNIINKLSIKLPTAKSSLVKQYDCDTNQLKASLIAKHLLNNWKTAYALSKSKGFDFYGILQPTLFTTKTNSEYFTQDIVKDNAQFEIQYNAVYSLIIEEIEKNCKSDKAFCSSIINGTDWLHGTNNIFIDFCHINSLGNKVIAQRMKSLLEN